MSQHTGMDRDAASVQRGLDRGPTMAEQGRSGHEDVTTEAFMRHQGLLFTVAYEMLGSAADAEDAVQETWLRWATVDVTSVRDHRAYLVRITTRKALDRMRTLRRRKESYVGPWLPEPLLTSPDVADDVELAESVSMAMLLVLETLTPTERAVFVLREVFDMPHDEIAGALDKTSAAVRQTARRARVHVASRRPRQAVSQARTREAFDAFRRAVETGDLQGLLDVLAPDVVLLADGGGVAQAARNPITGVDDVSRFLKGLSRRLGEGMSLHPVQVNAQPALLLRSDDGIDTVVTARLDHGVISALYAVRNPEKLVHVEHERAMNR